MYKDKSILIVDDSPIVRSLIFELLDKEGFTNIKQAENGEQAIDIFSKMKIDLVLLDYNMPGMNGGVVLNYLKEKDPDVIIVMLSDQTDKNIVISLMRKADDYLVKVEIEKLRGELLHVFNRCFSYQALKIKNKELMQKLSMRNQKLEEEIRMARKLQKEIFPDKIETSEVFSIFVLSKPSEAIGGDFFDVVRLDEKHVGIFLGDICGHGIQAALLSFTLANAFKAAIKFSKNYSAQNTIAYLNSLLIKQFPRGSFVSGSYMVLDENNGEISFSGAFETPLVHVTSSGNIGRLVNGNIAYLGLTEHQMVKIEESRITLHKGERIFAFTDGLIEVKNPEGISFGIENIENLLTKNHCESTKEVCNTMYRHIKIYGDNKIMDDVTIIGIERK